MNALICCRVVDRCCEQVTYYYPRSVPDTQTERRRQRTPWYASLPSLQTLGGRRVVDFLRMLDATFTPAELEVE